MVEFDQFTCADAQAVDCLLDQAFGPQRQLKTSQRLRDGRAPADGLAIVAKSGGKLVASISFWHVEAGGVPALLLGPVAVDCALQGQGIGRALIVYGLSRAASFGHRAVILVGDAPYYNRFGFSRALTSNLILPGPVEYERFLGLELVPGALASAAGLVVPTGAAASPMMPPLAPFAYPAEQLVA